MDRWHDQSIWDTVLSGVHVVVSTYAILADALGNGFVKMQTLALLIFDEGKPYRISGFGCLKAITDHALAHYCTLNHPANRIMKNFYYRQKKEGGLDTVPRILGLTASPVIRSNPAELR